MKKIKRLLKVILILLLVIIVALNFYFDSFLNKLDRETTSINKKELDISDSFNRKHRFNTITNIALFGVDNNDGDSFSFDEARSDATKIISLNHLTRKVKITSVERDLVVYLPERDEYGHLNWAYSFGGPSLALQTLNYNFDLNLNKYVTISFGGLQKIVDLIGGVDIELTDAEINQSVQPLNINGPAGTYTLNGEQALRYCRIRYIDSDFMRMERQNIVINKVLEKLKKENPLEMINIVTEVLPFVSTNLSNFEIKRYLLESVLFDLDNIETYKVPMGEYDDVYHAQGIGGYLVRDFISMVSDLHKNIYGINNYDPSDRVKENADNIYYNFGY